jgi:hypothetical protein
MGKEPFDQRSHKPSHKERNCRQSDAVALVDRPNGAALTPVGRLPAAGSDPHSESSRRSGSSRSRRSDRPQCALQTSQQRRGRRNRSPVLEPDGGESFITNREHRGFVPPVWWTNPAWKKSVGMYTPWLRERDLLRKAWSAGFPADITLELATTNLFLISHALDSDTPEEMETGPRKIWPYQRAVLFLHVNPWRAKTCLFCGKRFIAEHSKTKFCSYGEPDDDNSSPNCFWAHRQQYKKENWIENSDSINERRKREYRLEKKRSHRAKRKNIRQR